MELASRTSNICVCCYLPVYRPDKYEFSEHCYHQQNQLKTQVQPYFTSYRCVGHYFRVSGPFWLVPAPGRLERGGERLLLLAGLAPPCLARLAQSDLAQGKGPLLLKAHHLGSLISSAFRWRAWVCLGSFNIM